MKHRRAPLSDKTNSDSFKKLMYGCQSARSASVLNINRICSCNEGARQYMLMYKAIGAINFQDIDGIGDVELVNKHSILESSIKMIQRLTKKNWITKWKIFTCL